MWEGGQLVRRYFSPEAALGFFPGEHCNGPLIDLAQTLLDLIEPSLLRAFVDLLVEAFEQRVGKGGTPLWRE